MFCCDWKNCSSPPEPAADVLLVAAGDGVGVGGGPGIKRTGFTSQILVKNTLKKNIFFKKILETDRTYI